MRRIRCKGCQSPLGNMEIALNLKLRGRAVSRFCCLSCRAMRLDCTQETLRVHNEIVRLPDVEPGVYRLEYGLFTNSGEALVLANEGRMEDGYYPLEDPKEPV